ncbi:MAG: hypothetical protein JWO30_4602 [Fibrobacteres bacterium]|nr:hypothetical protein [Fibrobacterota bacterium]
MSHLIAQPIRLDIALAKAWHVKAVMDTAGARD